VAAQRHNGTTANWCRARMKDEKKRDIGSVVKGIKRSVFFRELCNAPVLFTIQFDYSRFKDPGSSGGDDLVGKQYRSVKVSTAEIFF